MTDTSPLRRRAFPLILAAALIIIAAIGLLAWLRDTPRDYAHRVFSTIPLPPGSREIDREAHDWAEGPGCPYARLAGAYVADASWEEVATFYQGYMQQSSWGQVERRILGRDIVANTNLEVIEGRRPFGESSRQSLTLTVVNFYQLSKAPPEATQTLFTIGVEYIPDVDFFRSSPLCQD